MIRLLALLLAAVSADASACEVGIGPPGLDPAVAQPLAMRVWFADYPSADTPVIAGLFADRDSFDARRDPLRSVVIAATGEPLCWQINALDAADYALLAFQDTNLNGLLDFDQRGLPLEPYTVSGKLPRRGPRFSLARTSVQQDGLELQLKQWRLYQPAGQSAARSATGEP